MTEVFDAYAAYYDLLYRDKDYPAEAQYVGSLLERFGVSRGELLELGCGTGKHAAHLAGLGYRVQGIDLSPSMIDIARRRTPKELATQLQFDVGDARTMRLGRKFDAAVSLFHVASYQTSNEDLAAMLGTAATHLRSGGVFVFDFWYGPGVLTDPPTERVKNLEDDAIQVTRTATPRLWPNENVVDVHYHVLIKQLRSANISEIEETHRMRYLFLPELKLMLESVGMELVRAERWMSAEPLDCRSWQAVVTARRA